ncbi:MAG: hypothetical protein M0013_14640 [Actinomycetota bacterium]|nr:hypothetical protein [Actinomycetota bacterium]
MCRYGRYPRRRCACRRDGRRALTEAGVTDHVMAQVMGHDVAELKGEVKGEVKGR